MLTYKRIFATTTHFSVMREDIRGKVLASLSPIKERDGLTEYRLEVAPRHSKWADAFVEKFNIEQV